jgi:hypothetical protein
MITFLLLFAATTAVTTIFFWKQANSLKYGNSHLVRSTHLLVDTHNALVLDLQARISELETQLNQKQVPSAPAPEKAQSPKRKYYRKPKGPKT